MLIYPYLVKFCFLFISVLVLAFALQNRGWRDQTWLESPWHSAVWPRPLLSSEMRGGASSSKINVWHMVYTFPAVSSLESLQYRDCVVFHNPPPLPWHFLHLLLSDFFQLQMIKSYRTIWTDSYLHSHANIDIVSIPLQLLDLWICPYP